MGLFGFVDGLSTQKGLLCGGGVLVSGKISETELVLAGVGLVLLRSWVHASIGLNSLYLTSGTIVEAVVGQSPYSTRLPGVTGSCPSC